MGDSSRGYRHYYEEYTEYAKNLRIWFVAYGIGCPAAFLTQDNLRRQILSANDAPVILGVFLAGVAVQITVALLYKATTWHLHFDVDINEKPRGPDWAHWIEAAYWIDIAFDLVTICLFAWPTIRVIQIITCRKG